MGYSHFNSHAFHGKGKAIILDGPRKANVKIDGKPATFHGYDKGRAVYVVYGRTGPGRVEINGETIEFSGNGIQRQGRVVGNSSGGSTNHRQNLERIVANGGGKAEVKAYLDKNGISARDVAVPVAAGTAVAAGREGGVPAGLGNFVPDSVKRKAWEMVAPGNTPADIASAVKAQGLSSTISGMASGAPAASLAYTPAGIGANPATAYIPSNLPVGSMPSAAAPSAAAPSSAYGFGPAYNSGLVSGGQAAGTSASMLANFAPWLAGGAAALGIWAGRENPVKRWNNLTSQYNQMGRQGGERPTSDYNLFGLNSVKQDAYDAGKAGKAYNPGKYSNAAAAHNARVQEAKTAVQTQGFAPSAVLKRNAGPTYSPKEKAAARVMDRSFAVSAPSKYNPFILTDADRGR